MSIKTKIFKKLNTGMFFKKIRQKIATKYEICQTALIFNFSKAENIILSGDTINLIAYEKTKILIKIPA